MRMLRRFILGLVLVAVALWIVRGPIFRAVVQYRIVGERGPVRPLPSSAPAAMDLRSAMRSALDTTAVLLRFSTGVVSNDPGDLLHGGPANCVGYTALTASLLLGHLKHAGLEGRYEVNAVIGRLYIGEIDLHGFLSSPFWKDHDVVRVKNKETGEETLLDPTLFDHFGIDRVSARPSN